MRCQHIWHSIIKQRVQYELYWRVTRSVLVQPSPIRFLRLRLYVTLGRHPTGTWSISRYPQRLVVQPWPICFLGLRCWLQVCLCCKLPPSRLNIFSREFLWWIFRGGLRSCGLGIAVFLELWSPATRKKAWPKTFLVTFLELRCEPPSTIILLTTVDYNLYHQHILLLNLTPELPPPQIIPIEAHNDVPAMVFVILTLSTGNNGDPWMVLTYKHEISPTLSWNSYRPSID